MKSVPLTVVVHDYFASELSSALVSQTFASPPVLRTIVGHTDVEVATMLAGTDVLVSGEFRPAWCAAGKTSRLRLVHSSGAGIDAIDLKSLPPGCKVCNVYGHERGVAEQAFMMMLALQRDLFKMDAALRKGDWTPQRAYLPELGNRNLLILGFGHIGAELARWGNFLDMNVTALTRPPTKVRSGKPAPCALGTLKELGEHLATADFVIVAIPATAETTDLIGEREFQQMKPGAFLINVGRARVVNEEALYKALRSRRIAGAGYDVWYEYPASLADKKHPSRFPLHELDNLIMTPHKPTIETMAYRWAKIAENIARFERGEALENVVCTV
jgi:phosphoglycerate dehydrogenase-like enzyme